MATLTEVTWMIRKGLVFGSIGVVVLTVMGILIWFGVKSTITEPPTPTPTPGIAFGALPELIFPESATRPTKYELLLIEGDPAPAQYANVYFVPKKAPTLFSRKNATELANQLGFKQDPVITNTTRYEYKDPISKNTLTIDIPYKYYTYVSGPIDINEYLSKIPDDEAKLTEAAEAYLKSLKLWSEDLKDSYVTYVVWNGSGFTPQQNNKVTNFARIDFFNPSINEVPILFDKLHETNVYVIFGYKEKNQRVMVGSKYRYYQPDINQSSTYPTKSGENAWNELIAGGGYISSPVKGGGNKAMVRRMHIGYYQPDEYQPYVQPVWVFDGDNDFQAMVPAIDPSVVGAPSK